MAYTLKVRDELINRGITNDQIGWDQATGNVTVGGQNFIQPQRNFQGTTFTDQPTFNQAWSTYEKSQQQPAQQQVRQAVAQPTTQPTAQPSPYQGAVFTPAETGMTWQQMLPYYAQNPQAGQAELQRAQQALGIYRAMGDIPKAQAAEDWIGKLGNVVNPPPSPQDAQVQQLIEQIMGQMGQRESFDPYASPEFAAQEARSQRAAQQGIRSAQEALGSAGFGRSTVLGERAQSIQNEQEDFLRTQVIPQIIAQNEARRQQELQNQMAMLSPLMQQQGFMEERQRFEQEFDYQKARDAIADERYKLEFDEDVRRYGEQFALDKAIKQGQLDVARYGAQTSRMGAEQRISQQNLDNLYRQWETTGIAPEGIPGVEAGSPFPKEGDPKFFEAQVISGITQFDNAEDALGWISANSEEITKQLGAKGYENMRKMVQSQFTTGEEDLRDRATKYAQNDVRRWYQATTKEEREALIDEYVELLRVR